MTPSPQDRSRRLPNRVRKWRGVLVVFGMVTIAGCITAILAAFFAGAIERSWHPHEPDPVDFRIGGVFIATWLVSWTSLIAAVWAFFARNRASTGESS